MVGVSLLLALPSSCPTFTRQLPSGAHSVLIPWSCAPDKMVSQILVCEWVPMLHTTNITCKAALRHGREEERPRVLCGRIFALWMTPDLGSWNWFPHTGFWFLCSLLLLHVAAAFLLSVHWIRMKQNGILLYFSSICPPTRPH